METKTVKGNESETIIVIVAVAIIVLFIIAGNYYNTHKYKINQIIIGCIRMQLAVTSFVSQYDETLSKNLKNIEPDELSVKQLWALTSYAGKRLRWLIVPLSLFIGAIIYFKFGKVQRYRRTMDMQMLLKNNVKIFPELAPIVNRKRPITDEPMDEGLWKTARSPIQFALENGLIIDDEGHIVQWHEMIGSNGIAKEGVKALRMKRGLVLDLAKAEYIFATQLGNVFEGPQKLKPHQKALAAALLAYAHSDRAAGISMLNQLSVSFREPAKPEYSKRDLKYHQKLIAAALLVYIHSDKATGIIALSQTFLLLSEPLQNEFAAKRMSRRMVILAALLIYAYSDRTAGIRMLCQLLPLNAPQLNESKDGFVIDTSGADELLRRYSTDHKKLKQHACYTNCWMSALLEFARGKGVIACSKFIWLRPADRILWYALNQCGRRVAWCEAAGVRAHLQVEDDQGKAITTPQVEGAVMALEESLFQSGYIYLKDSKD